MRDTRRLPANKLLAEFAAQNLIQFTPLGQIYCDIYYTCTSSKYHLMITTYQIHVEGTGTFVPFRGGDPMGDALLQAWA